MKRLLVTAVVVMVGLGAEAQDTRTVTEPVIPPVCATLTAQLHGPITAADEAKLDTERLQKGLDGCAKGHALELAADGAANAFVSGPAGAARGRYAAGRQGCHALWFARSQGL